MDMAPYAIEEKGQRSSLIALDHVVPFIAHRSVVPSGLGWDTKSWLECGNFHSSCPSLPTRAGAHLMNMVIMGNHSINGARSKLLVVFTQISTTIAHHQIQSHFEMDFRIESDCFSDRKEFFTDPSCL